VSDAACVRVCVCVCVCARARVCVCVSVVVRYRHFAVYNNLGDVASKESSQELMVSLVGMISGAVSRGFPCVP
jgi:hypothetical protein